MTAHKWFLVAHIPLSPGQVEQMVSGGNPIPSEWNMDNTTYYGPGCAVCGADWHTAGSDCISSEPVA